METKFLPSPKEDALECEKLWTFLLLMFVGGFFGAFTYSIRGGVFCNAQTANFVLSAVALGNGRRGEFLYYFIPMTAYFLGTFISESVPNYIKLILPQNRHLAYRGITWHIVAKGGFFGKQ